jgi:hypothetical protein
LQRGRRGPSSLIAVRWRMVLSRLEGGTAEALRMPRAVLELCSL